MKKVLLRTSFFCALLAATAMAQNSGTSSSSRDATSSGSSGSPTRSSSGIGSSSSSSSQGGTASSSSSISGGQQQSLMGTKLMGAKVQGQQGDSLGTVQDVIINPQSGKVEFALLSPGSTGTGDKVVAVPWKLLSASSSGAIGQPTFTAIIDKSKLQSAPSFDKSRGPDMSSSDWSQKIYSHFGVEPETATGGTGSGTGTSGSSTSGSGATGSGSGSSSSGSGSSGSSGSGSSGSSGSGLQ